MASATLAAQDQNPLSPLKRVGPFFNDRHAGTLFPLWPLQREARHDDGVLVSRPPSFVRSAADGDEDGRPGSDVPKQSCLESVQTEEPSLPERDPAASAAFDPDLALFEDDQCVMPVVRSIGHGVTFEQYHNPPPEASGQPSPKQGELLSLTIVHRAVGRANDGKRLASKSMISATRPSTKRRTSSASGRNMVSPGRRT